jgi:hypothetical protein
MPRGTATYTPKWSIVVLAVACLGVLKYNGLYGKSDPARERPATASFLPVIETKQGPNNPYGSRSEGSNHINSAAMDHVKNRR